MTSKEEQIIEAITTVTYWLISSLFIMLGWNALAYYIQSLPIITFWHTFFIRMGISSIMGILWQKVR